MDFQTILVEKKGRIGILTVNRPDKLNAFNSLVIEEISAAFRELEEDPAVKVIVITGAGSKAFVIGADISEMRDMNPSQALEFAQRGQKFLESLERSDKVVIAAMNGHALGGGLELSMACDLRIASTSAQVGQPEIRLGVIPGWAGTQRLVRLVGKTKAKELILTGGSIPAEEAERIGIVNKAVPPEALMAEAMKVAETIASWGTFALKAAKHAIDQGSEVGFEKAQEIERQLFAQCFAHPDQKEGMAAFLEKRTPHFS